MPASSDKSNNFSVDKKIVVVSANKGRIFLFSFLSKTILVLFILFVFSVVANSIFWFIVEKTRIPKNIRQLGFYRYFTNNRYTNLGYRILFSSVFKNDSQKYWNMIRPYPQNPYLVRGRNYEDLYTYGLVGKYKRAYEAPVIDKQGSNKLPKVIVEVESAAGRTYRLSYQQQDAFLASNQKIYEELRLSEINRKKAVGIPLDPDEENFISSYAQQDISEEGAVSSLTASQLNGQFSGLFYPTTTYTGGAKRIDDFFKNSKNKLVLAKFVSDEDIETVWKGQDKEYSLLMLSAY